MTKVTDDWFEDFPWEEDRMLHQLLFSLARQPEADFKKRNMDDLESIRLPDPPQNNLDILLNLLRRETLENKEDLKHHAAAFTATSEQLEVVIGYLKKAQNKITELEKKIETRPKGT